MLFIDLELNLQIADAIPTSQIQQQQQNSKVHFYLQQNYKIDGTFKVGI